MLQRRRSDARLGNTSTIPPELALLAKRLASLVPEQKFDILLAHRYVIGGYVGRHRDPYNQLGAIVITLLGDFEGGVSEFTELMDLI